jgi:hypothetical protein
MYLKQETFVERSPVNITSHYLTYKLVFLIVLIVSVSFITFPLYFYPTRPTWVSKPSTDGRCGDGPLSGPGVADDHHLLHSDHQSLGAPTSR